MRRRPPGGRIFLVVENPGRGCFAFEKVPQVQSKVGETVQEKHRGSHFIEVAHQGKIVRDKFENAQPRIDEIEQGDQPQGNHEERFHSRFILRKQSAAAWVSR